jgi:hypothetical protein
MKVCEVCGRSHPEKHHIVFRSQGGLDYDLNFKYLCAEHHKGNYSPHKNRYVDLTYKGQLQEKLFAIFSDYDYSIAEVSELIGYNGQDIYKLFKIAQPNSRGRYDSETVVRVLMGGKLY